LIAADESLPGHDFTLVVPALADAHLGRTLELVRWTLRPLNR
jgi:hypothetical protein